MQYCIRVYLATDQQENKLIMCTFCLLNVGKNNKNCLIEKSENTYRLQYSYTQEIHWRAVNFEILKQNLQRHLKFRYFFTLQDVTSEQQYKHIYFPEDILHTHTSHNQVWTWENWVFLKVWSEGAGKGVVGGGAGGGCGGGGGGL